MNEVLSNLSAETQERLISRITKLEAALREANEHRSWLVAHAEKHEARWKALEADVKRITKLEADVKRLLLDKGRLQARTSTFMQAMAWFARQPGMQASAQGWVSRADYAASKVRIEDMVVAHLNAARGERKP